MRFWEYPPLQKKTRHLFGNIGKFGKQHEPARGLLEWSKDFETGVYPIEMWVRFANGETATIPSTLKMEVYAFHNCGLTSLTIPNSVTFFHNPNALHKIGKEVFPNIRQVWLNADNTFNGTMSNDFVFNSITAVMGKNNSYYC